MMLVPLTDEMGILTSAQGIGHSFQNKESENLRVALVSILLDRRRTNILGKTSQKQTENADC
jgi:hypothetical protein